MANALLELQQYQSYRFDPNWVFSLFFILFFQYGFFFFSFFVPMREIWSKARALQYRHKHSNVSAPSYEQINTFLSTTAPEYVPEFNEINRSTQSHPSNHWLDQPFTVDELQLALYSKTKNTAPGLDNISYTILKHLPLSALSLIHISEPTRPY